MTYFASYLGKPSVVLERRRGRRWRGDCCLILLNESSNLANPPTLATPCTLHLATRERSLENLFGDRGLVLAEVMHDVLRAVLVN